MKCLFCGKGIGPIRQLRDLEFCSESHRTEFKDRYRQQLYEALAPEPGPSRLADFLERPSDLGGPAPYAVLAVLPKPLPVDAAAGMPAPAAIGVDRPGWSLGLNLASMPARLAWQGDAAAYPSFQPEFQPAALALAVAPPARSSAGAAAVCFEPALQVLRPAAAAGAICASARYTPASASLPEAAQAGAPPQAESTSPRLLAATPAAAELSALGALTPAIRSATALPCSGTVTGPAAPPKAQAAQPAGFSAAVLVSEPHPLEAGPLAIHRDLQTSLERALPVAFEAQGTRNTAIFLPKPPVAAAPSGRLSAAGTSPFMAPAAKYAAPAMPGIQAGSPSGEPVESGLPRPVDLAPMMAATPLLAAALPFVSPSWSAARSDYASNPLGPLGDHVSPLVECPAASIGALAGIVPPAATVREAAGNQTPHPVEQSVPARTSATALARSLTALPGGPLPCAPEHRAPAPVPAAPPAAALSWGAALAMAAEPALVPLPDIALPSIDCLPAPAGAVTPSESALRPGVGRSVGSCAVLWTLRVVHLCHPPFRLDPIRAKFSDLVRSDRSTPYVPELSERKPAKNNLRPFKLPEAPRSGRPKWQYIGMAAAALLVAGVLIPQKAPKLGSLSLGQSLPWHGISIRQWMTERATRNFADDFRAGLSQWKGLAKGSKNWTYSADGFIHPAQLALYRPSVPLSDYRFEFMAQVENKSVDWVVRAKDANNYYALKFTVLQPGPRPTMAMVRYPVIGGNKGERTLTPLRMMIHANTPYRVTVDVKGNHYRAYVEGQEADFWTEDRLKTGGVGFFSEAGERARVYWVKLESHGDILGRICGMLSGKGSGGATDKEKEAMDYRHAGTTDLNGGARLGGAEAAASTAQEARISRVLSKAASLHLDGKLDDAARELVRALDGGERHPALYFALGQLQYEMQDYGPAALSYTQTALLQPLHPTAHFNAGVCQGRIERWEEAASSFRKAISNDPARSEAHLALGACLVQLGLHNEALEAYDRFLEAHPDHDEALFGKAVALQKRDRSSEAVELYKRILNRNPRSEEALSNLVSLSLANQDYEQVRKYAQRLAEAQPKSQIALEGLAGAAFAAGDHQSAADYSRKLAELAPQVFENWFNLGVACHKAGDLGNASDAYARATRVQSDSPQAHLNLGVALQEQGDLKGARAAYQKALDIDPKLPGVHWNLGLAHEQLGDTEAAEKLYAQVPENSPDSDDAAFRIGHLRLQRADYPGSIQAFEACLLKRPNWPEARLNLGIAHWRSGDKEAARTCFQELTASGTESKEALRGLAALSLEHQEYDKAFEIYRQLLDAGERSPELLYNAGLICQRRGEPEDAAVLYREALKADPQFGEALLNLGHALMSLGNEFEARSCWRKAVIAKPELAQRYFEPAAMAS